jgi:hypothetical protein
MKARVMKTTVFVLACMLLALPTPVLATPPEPLTIEADLWLTGENSAAGVFNATGLFEDSGYDFGDASEVFFMADGTIHGVKTLVGEAGTITINFQAQVTWTGPTSGVAEGRFVIISGTGAYEKLHGTGETHAELNLGSYHIWAKYTGMAHFD